MKIVKVLEKKLQRLILKWLYDLKLLEFTTWKSMSSYCQYTSISFMGKEIKRIKWSELEILNKL